MIKVLFSGGLGNQMFLYAYLYAQIKENNLKPDIYAIMSRNKYEDKKNFALKSLSCTAKMNVIDEEEAKFDIKFKKVVKDILFRILLKIKLSDNNIIQIFQLLNICCHPKIFKYYPNLKVFNNYYVEGGCFQSWKYFENYKDEIIKQFKVSKKANKKNLKLLEEISSNNSVCVHIRRGDYTNSHYSKFLQICDYNYYKKAMDHIASKIENPKFYIFSNSHEDHEWIKKNYKFDYNIVHVDLGNPDYEELRLMYSCKHFILSNSSFSWWAQYLSSNDDKIVAAPSKWYLDEKQNTEDIYMPNWDIIDV